MAFNTVKLELYIYLTSTSVFNAKYEETNLAILESSSTEGRDTFKLLTKYNDITFYKWITIYYQRITQNSKLRNSATTTFLMLEIKITGIMVKRKRYTYYCRTRYKMQYFITEKNIYWQETRRNNRRCVLCRKCSEKVRKLNTFIR
jgi:hypothetical protein